ncbi:MAG: DUF342 domain-containing protein [Clostridium sp.]
MNLVFSAGSIEQCLNKASEALGISKDNIEYTVIKEERKFLRKIVTIEIKNKEKAVSSEEINYAEKNISYGAEIRNGIISVKSSDDKDGVITIKSCEGVDLFYNGVKTNFIQGAKESDEIKYIIKRDPEPSQSMKISISKDKMEAYITIQSIPHNTYELEDSGLSKNLVLNRVIVKQEFAPKITPNQVKEALREKNIVFGILDEKIEEVCNENEVNNVLIAKGVQAVEGIPEKIEILFRDYDQLQEIADTQDTIDYRNRFLLATVKPGEDIAKIIPAQEGKDGKDVLGNEVKRKIHSGVKFKIGDGCKYENGRVIAVREGKPSFKLNIFKVNEVYKVNEVNLATGNVNFVADVEVEKTVEEGMEVISGNNVFVGGNVDSATIKASSNIVVEGNILNSTIIAGENIINKKKNLLILDNIKSIIKELYSALIQVTENNLLGSRNVGELAKVLIENKYTSLISLCNQLLKEGEYKKDSPIAMFINNKIIGFGPLNITDKIELLEFIDLLEDEEDNLKRLEMYDARVYAEYIQGSKVESMGSIIIRGKGQYTSEITASKNIEFTSYNSVCRGGVLSAGKEIKLKSVGSEAGVNTVLKVPREGIITADIAYSNTIFCFGEKQLVLEKSSKNVRAYLDSIGDIVIEKLLL